MWKPSSTTSVRSIFARTAIAHALLLGPASVALAADHCAYPDEGNMPLRRAVSRVKHLPETLEWSQARHDAGELVQYRLDLEQPQRHRGRCYWPVEVHAGGKLWRRFLVTPDGRHVLGEATPPR
jgi:hypothetical protein